jgi:hypothetical protein
MNVNWVKCEGQQWCNFQNLNLDHSHFNNLGGVYIIWHGGPQARVVRVGQGNIRDRLKAHRQDAEILKYGNLGLFTTWADVASSYRDGVERYLAEKWKPIVGTKFPDVPVIEVNSPW